MTEFEIWTHTKTDEDITLVVLPMKSREPIKCDLVKARKVDDDIFKLDFLQSAQKKEGRATVLLHAISALGLANGLSTFTGDFGPIPGTRDYVIKWYLEHNISVQNGKLAGSISEVLDACSQIMNNYALTYKLTDEPIYLLK